MKKYCKKCNLELPPNHKIKYCVGPRHACWCDDELNQWRLKNKIISYAGLRKAFFKTISKPIILK